MIIIGEGDERFALVRKALGVFLLLAMHWEVDTGRNGVLDGWNVHMDDEISIACVGWWMTLP